MAINALLTQIYKILQPIRVSIRMMLARAIVRVAYDSKNMQLLQIEVLSGEIKENVEHIQQYGFTSVVNPGAEALVGFINGNKDHGIVIKVDDSRVRLKGLENGEVAVYHESGSFIKLKKDGSITMESVKDVIIKQTGTIQLGGDTLSVIDGVVTKQCICSFTGVSHPESSTKVLATKF